MQEQQGAGQFSAVALLPTLQQPQKGWASHAKQDLGIKVHLPARGKIFPWWEKEGSSYSGSIKRVCFSPLLANRVETAEG